MIRELIRACHPLPAAAVTAVSGGLALALGEPAGTATLAAATIAASQLSVGWANDAIDARRDQAVRRPDKPLAVRTDLIGPVTVAAVLAGVATLSACVLWGWPQGFWLAVALLSAQLYNWPLKATPASIVPYLVSFGALPAFLTRTPPWWIVVAAALLGGGAHLVNAIPDLQQDEVTGVRGLPQRLGARGSLYLASGLLLAATAVLIAGARPVWWVSAVALAAALALPVLGRLAPPRTTFHAMLVVAAIDVTLLLLSGALR